MKKTLSVVLMLVLMLAMTVQTVLAQGTLELIEARNDLTGAVIFIFRYTGEFNKNDFKGGQVFLGDMKFPMNCNIVDKAEGIVQCTTSRAVAGQYVQINLAGQVFWAFVPLRTGRPVVDSGPAPEQVCYTVYSRAWDDSENPPWWNPIDIHCPEETPTDGETIEYQPSWWFEFWTIISPGYCGVPGNDETGYFEECNFQ